MCLLLAAVVARDRDPDPDVEGGASSALEGAGQRIWPGLPQEVRFAHEPDAPFKEGAQLRVSSGPSSLDPAAELLRLGRRHTAEREEWERELRAHRQALASPHRLVDCGMRLAPSCNACAVRPAHDATAVLECAGECTSEGGKCVQSKITDTRHAQRHGSGGGGGRPSGVIEPPFDTDQQARRVVAWSSSLPDLMRPSDL